MRQDVLDIEEDIQAILFGQLDHAKQDRGRAPAFVTAKKNNSYALQRFYTRHTINLQVYVTAYPGNPGSLSRQAPRGAVHSYYESAYRLYRWYL